VSRWQCCVVSAIALQLELYQPDLIVKDFSEAVDLVLCSFQRMQFSTWPPPKSREASDTASSQKHCQSRINVNTAENCQLSIWMPGIWSKRPTSSLGYHPVLSLRQPQQHCSTKLLLWQESKDFNPTRRPMPTKSLNVNTQAIRPETKPTGKTMPVVVMHVQTDMQLTYVWRETGLAFGSDWERRLANRCLLEPTFTLWHL